MTGRVLAAIGESRGSVVAFLARVLFALPILVLAIGLDLAVWIWRLVRSHLVLSRSAMCCRRGHEVVLLGAWRCACGLVYEGHAFAPCPHCGEMTDVVLCPCGLPVPNPLADEARR